MSNYDYEEPELLQMLPPMVVALDPDEGDEEYEDMFTDDDREWEAPEPTPAPQPEERSPHGRSFTKAYPLPQFLAMRAYVAGGTTIGQQIAFNLLRDPECPQELVEQFAALPEPELSVEYNTQGEAVIACTIALPLTEEEREIQELQSKVGALGALVNDMARLLVGSYLEINRDMNQYVGHTHRDQPLAERINSALGLANAKD